MDQTQCVICGQGSLVCGGRSIRRLKSIEIAVKDGFEHGVVSSIYYILSFYDAGFSFYAYVLFSFLCYAMCGAVLLVLLVPKLHL
jgi:hypothetical protein